MVEILKTKTYPSGDKVTEFSNGGTLETFKENGITTRVYKTNGASAAFTKDEYGNDALYLQDLRISDKLTYQADGYSTRLPEEDRLIETVSENRAECANGITASINDEQAKQATGAELQEFFIENKKLKDIMMLAEKSEKLPVVDATIAELMAEPPLPSPCKTSNGGMKTAKNLRN